MQMIVTGNLFNPALETRQDASFNDKGHADPASACYACEQPTKQTRAVTKQSPAVRKSSLSENRLLPNPLLRGIQGFNSLTQVLDFFD